VGYRTKPGVSEEVVRQISAYKQEPGWVLAKRLAGLRWMHQKKLPAWGPNLDSLKLKKIIYFNDPGQKEARRWEEVPEEIRETFEKLGIPQAEREALAGVGAQYEATMAYHNLKQEWEEKGVIFENFDTAVQKYPELVEPYFMTRCVPVGDHYFAALHAAVFSGGTFIYVPKNVKVELPLQAYFRMNSPGMGQFEHTLIIADEGSEVHYIEGCSAPQYTENNLHAGCVEIFVKPGARVRYSSIENWSRNTYNLNTKRAIVEKDGLIEWVNGNLGSGVTMLYPCSILLGEGARSDSIGIAVAGAGQNQDTGSKAIHLAPHTSSTVVGKSISKDGGITTYRGLLKVVRGAHHVKSSITCDALIMDEASVSNTIPQMNIREEEVDIGHEARVGRISEEQIFYARSRGLSEAQARQLIVAGFIEPVVKELPLEYAVELNRLIELEMEGSVG
jgi:Fe-S cluster assembly protein SufB